MQNVENNKKNIEYLSSSPCVGLELSGSNLLLKLRKLMGPDNPIEAKKI
jgi:nucleoside diphosphate kinase